MIYYILTTLDRLDQLELHENTKLTNQRLVEIDPVSWERLLCMKLGVRIPRVLTIICIAE